MAEDRQLNTGKLNSTMQDPDERRNNGHMRGKGGKAQLIYRPGSGPLKKSDDEPQPPQSKGGPGQGRHPGPNWRKPSMQLYQPPTVNSRESTPGPPEGPSELVFKMSGLNMSTADNDSSDEKKKGKKPDLTIYVPRAKAQAIAEGVDEPPWEAQAGGGGGGGGRGRGPKKMSGSNSWEQEGRKGGKPDVWDRGSRRNMEEVPEWRKPSNKEQGRRGGKGFGKRGQADDPSSWRSQSPLQRSESMSGLSPARDVRQNSEPRSLPYEGRPQSNRGSEPPMKPPMGPRGGRGPKPNMQSLPPRFQKMQAAAANHEEPKSLGAVGFAPGHSQTLPQPPKGQQQQQQRRHDEHRQQQQQGGRNARSTTPDQQFKRPKTPPQQQQKHGGRGRRPSPSGRRTPNQEWGGRRSPLPVGMRRTPSQESVGRRRGGKNRKRYNSGGSSLDENGHFRDRRSSDPRVTPQPSRVTVDKTSEDESESVSIPVPEITDWCAEVEESERLENEALASESESNAPKSELTGKRRNKKKRDRKKRGDDSSRGKDLSERPAEKAQGHKGGLLILPPKSEHHHQSHSPPSQQLMQRALFDPNNPTKPIIMKTAGMRMPQPQYPQYSSPPEMHMRMPFPPGQFVHPGHFPQQAYNKSMMQQGPDSLTGKPAWYDHYSDNFRLCRNPHLLIDIERADVELTRILNTVGVLPNWPNICQIRQFLLNKMMELLIHDLKFCEGENVEQHIWKLTFYNVIELLRKGQSEETSAELKELHKKTLLAVIEDGVKFYENLLAALQETYQFSVEELTGPSAPMLSQGPVKMAGFTNLAIVAAQKACLSMGDLARYREQANDTSNYNKARQWYTKAQLLNPKNGRPYNQLAILALYARRKLDAVYYYMRSLMASNPFYTARESLLSLFDENRKKFESLEKKRKDEQAAEEKERQQEKEAIGRGLRREIWVHPDNSLKEWLTPTEDDKSSTWREEELAKMSFTELNRQFLTSYLHVQGKLFTKIGMETFQEAAHQMLREFRALLQHSPVPVSCTRFLQLLALNMFAIENTQLKDRDIEPGYRSVMQENALIVSLQMFNLILERCASLFPAPAAPATAIQELGDVSEDLQTLLPAIKVWCDWLLCHKAVWNPPPSCADYVVGPAGDAWNRLANLVNRLEKLDLSTLELSTTDQQGYELLKLPEDLALAGFTPLMYNMQELVYVPSNTDMELAYNCLRIKKVQFFGTAFLCGVDPPVLKLQRFDNDRSYYVSLVDPSRSPVDTPTATSLGDMSDLERTAEVKNGEHSGSVPSSPCSPETSNEIKSLLSRKEELTRTHLSQEWQRQQAQAILEQTALAGCVEMKVRPRYLVPDTNCFIDHLESLQQLGSFTLMVPLVVIHELEGLARGSRSPQPLGAPSENAQHVKMVAERSSQALAYLRGRPQGVRLVTSKGTVLAPTGVAMEEEELEMKNDDRILNACLSLNKLCSRDECNGPLKPGEVRHLLRDTVLLTEDRNLRVKCLARDVPVRTIVDFIKWATRKQ